MFRGSRSKSVVKAVHGGARRASSSAVLFVRKYGDVSGFRNCSRDDVELEVIVNLGAVQPLRRRVPRWGMAWTRAFELVSGQVQQRSAAADMKSFFLASSLDNRCRSDSMRRSGMGRMCCPDSNSMPMRRHGEEDGQPLPDSLPTRRHGEEDGQPLPAPTMGNGEAETSETCAPPTSGRGTSSSNANVDVRWNFQLVRER